MNTSQGPIGCDGRNVRSFEDDAAFATVRPFSENLMGDCEGDRSSLNSCPRIACI